MRALRLARIAAEAEGLRLRYSAQRTVVRAILGLIALGFLFGAAGLLPYRRVVLAAAVLGQAGGGADPGRRRLVLAAILALLAARSSPGRIEIEALAVRRRALESATSSLAFSALPTQLLPLAVRLFRRR